VEHYASKFFLKSALNSQFFDTSYVRSSPNSLKNKCTLVAPYCGLFFNYRGEKDTELDTKHDI
jgi:hypothetical protein